jgi:hypothetical protein
MHAASGSRLGLTTPVIIETHGGPAMNLAALSRLLCLGLIALSAAFAVSCGGSDAGDAATPTAISPSNSAAAIPTVPPRPTKKDVRDALATAKAFVSAVETGDAGAAKKLLCADAGFSLADLQGEAASIALTDDELEAAISTEGGGASRTTLGVGGWVIVTPAPGSDLREGRQAFSIELRRETPSDPWGVYYIAFR